jgi:hypothetical protein
MSDEHSQFKFSVTIHTGDPALLASMRGLTWHSQKTGQKMIAVGGTKEPQWRANDHKATFRFTSPSYRAEFIHHAERIFRKELWILGPQNDNDPAIPQEY